MTIAEQWRREGRMEGEASGQAKALSRLLSRKFGEHVFKLSAQDRLVRATPEQLDIWTDRILDAKTIEDVFSV